MEEKKITLVKQENYFHSIIKAKSLKEVELDGGGVGIEIEWYASTKDKDRMQDIVLPEAFQSAIDIYMTNPIILLQHDHDRPVGVVTSTQIVKNKWLYFRGLITEDDNGLFSKLKNGVLRALSIGYRVKDYEVKEKKDEDDNVIGYDYIIKELELFEISIVSVPANPYALLKSMESCFDYQNETKAPISIDKKAEVITEEKDLSVKKDATMEKTFDEVKKEQDKIDLEAKEIESEEEKKKKPKKPVEVETPKEEETPAEETPKEETPTPIADELQKPKEEPASDEGAETPKEEEAPATEETPADETPKAEEEVPAEETPKENIETEIPVETPPAPETEQPKEETPAPATEEAPVVDAPAKEEEKAVEVKEDVLPQAKIEETKSLDSPEKVVEKTAIDSEKSINELKEMNGVLEKQIGEQKTQLESLEKSMTEMSEVFKKALEYMLELKKFVSSLPISKGYTFEKVETKRSAYGNVVDAIKAIAK